MAETTIIDAIPYLSEADALASGGEPLFSGDSPETLIGPLRIAYKYLIGKVVITDPTTFFAKATNAGNRPLRDSSDPAFQVCNAIRCLLCAEFYSIVCHIGTSC